MDDGNSTKSAVTRRRGPRTSPSQVDYYARMIQKIQFKKYEAYAISRVLHRLDDPEIELVTQQSVHTAQGLALLDLYLPQFGIALEIDELHHLDPLSREADRAREQRVIALAGVKFVRLGIGTGEARDAFTQKVDGFIDSIRAAKRDAIAAGAFTPFSFGARQDPQHWISRGRLSIDDDAQLGVMTDVTRLFGYLHRHWQRAALRLPDGRLLWMPTLAQEDAPRRSDWDNRLVAGGTRIVETQLGDWARGSYDDVDRVVFARFRDPVFGTHYYRFLGVFRLVAQDARSATFERIATAIDLAEAKGRDARE